jgi:hypothetical protein
MAMQFSSDAIDAANFVETNGSSKGEQIMNLGDLGLIGIRITDIDADKRFFHRYNPSVYVSDLTQADTLYTYICPGCETKVFHISCPIVERRPDGSELRRELLCRNCHQISRPAWRYSGKQRVERAVLQRISMLERLGNDPTKRPSGVQGQRHTKWFNRLIASEKVVSSVSKLTIGECGFQGLSAGLSFRGNGP